MPDGIGGLAEIAFKKSRAVIFALFGQGRENRGGDMGMLLLGDGVEGQLNDVVGFPQRHIRGQVADFRRFLGDDFAPLETEAGADAVIFLIGVPVDAGKGGAVGHGA